MIQLADIVQTSTAALAARVAPLARRVQVVAQRAGRADLAARTGGTGPIVMVRSGSCAWAPRRTMPISP